VIRTTLAAASAALCIAGAATASPTERAAVVSVATDGAGAVTLATAPDVLESPTFSPDGRSVAYVHDLRTIDVVGSDGTGTRALQDISTGTFYASVIGVRWAPDGKTVVAPVIGSPGDPRDAYATLFTFDAASGSVIWRHLGLYASFSRDGRYLAYQTHERGPAGEGGDTIGVCRPDGTSDRAFGAGSYAAWSPTADRVAYVTSRGYLTASGPAGQARWTLRATKAGPIAWSPDGKTIAFAHIGTRSALFVVSAGSRRVRRLVDLPAADGPAPLAVSFSPNGRWIAVSSDAVTFLVRRDGTGFRALRAGSATWSPRAPAELAVISGNQLSAWTPGSGSQVIYTGRVMLAQPSWSPDGTRIVLVDSE
jgi:Tol biopolymer transport system component